MSKRLQDTTDIRQKAALIAILQRLDDLQCRTPDLVDDAMPRDGETGIRAEHQRPALRRSRVQRPATAKSYEIRVVLPGSGVRTPVTSVAGSGSAARVKVGGAEKRQASSPPTSSVMVVLLRVMAFSDLLVAVMEKGSDWAEPAVFGTS